MTAGNPGHSFVLHDGVGFAQTPGAVAVLQAEPGAALVVPHGTLLLVADFVRQGSDLLLVGSDGTQILIKGYFALDHPPALTTEGGAILAPDLVARLAGPRAPGQYAQAAPGAEGLFPKATRPRTFSRPLALTVRDFPEVSVQLVCQSFLGFFQLLALSTLKPRNSFARPG